MVFGGRIVIAGGGSGCLSCLDILDTAELAREQMTDEQRAVHDKIYGITRDELGGSGPSVVTLNGVIASLAATEIMCLVTNLRPPALQLQYRGDLGTVLRDRAAGREGCPFCLRWRARSSRTTSHAELSLPRTGIPAASSAITMTGREMPSSRETARRLRPDW